MTAVASHRSARTHRTGTASGRRAQADDYRGDLIHDLLQPLSGILALTDITSPPRTSGEEYQRIQQVRALAGWMQKLLQSSQQVREHDDPAHGKCDAAAVCRSLVATAAQLGTDVTLECGDVRAPVQVQDVVLRRIVGNVFDNAVRAAGPGGHVKLRVAVRDQRVVIGVTDDGPGFGRIEGKTGRGLSITRRLLESCHGSIGLTKPRHGGVHVSISLPLTATPGRRAS